MGRGLIGIKKLLCYSVTSTNRYGGDFVSFSLRKGHMKIDVNVHTSVTLSVVNEPMVIKIIW